MAKINSRAKGAAGERELAKYINARMEEEKILSIKLERSQQFAGNSGDADVRGLPGVHIECKRVENLNLGRAYTQAEEDSKESDIPIVMHRKNHGKWMATLSLDDLLTLYVAAYKAGEFDA